MFHPVFTRSIENEPRYNSVVCSWSSFPMRLLLKL